MLMLQTVMTTTQDRHVKEMDVIQQEYAKLKAKYVLPARQADVFW